MTSPTKISTGGVKKGRNEGLKIITANRLTDGIVVYRRADGGWTELLAAAAVVEGDDALSLLEATQGEETCVVGPYLMDIEISHGAILPGGRGMLRETIRDQGPTIHPQFGRQAEEKVRHVSL